MGDIKRKTLFEKTNLLSNVYYLASAHKKLLESLVQSYEETQYQRGDVIFDWNKNIDRLYIIKEGEVKLLRRKKVHSTDEYVLGSILDGRKEEFEKPMMLIPDLKMPKMFEEIGMRSNRQCFGEEHFVIKQPTSYRAIVCSEIATIVTIPFTSVSLSLKGNFDFFKEGR